MNRCILGEINDKTYILAKSPKVHKGGGSTPPPIGGYLDEIFNLLDLDLGFLKRAKVKKNTAKEP